MLIASKDSCNSRKLKTIYQSIVKMAATSPRILPGYKIYALETGIIQEALPIIEEINV